MSRPHDSLLRRAPTGYDAATEAALVAIDDALTAVAGLGTPETSGRDGTAAEHAAALARSLMRIAKANEALGRDESGALAELCATLCHALVVPDEQERVWAFLTAALAALAGQGERERAPGGARLLVEAEALARSVAMPIEADALEILVDLPIDGDELPDPESQYTTPIVQANSAAPDAEYAEPIAQGDPPDQSGRYDPMVQFVRDSRVRLTHLGSVLAALRATPSDRGLQDDARHAFHSLKGEAALLGLTGLERIARAVQFLMDDAQARARFDAQIVALIEAAHPLIGAYLDAGEATWEGEAMPILPGHEALERAIGEAKERIARPRERPTRLSQVSDSLYTAYVTRLPQDLRTLHSSLVTLRREPANEAALAEVRRALHGLKSRSSMVQIISLVRVAEAAEDLLEQCTNDGVVTSLELLDRIIQSEDVFYEAEGLLRGGSFDAQHESLDNLAAQVCIGMRQALHPDASPPVQGTASVQVPPLASSTAEGLSRPGEPEAAAADAGDDTASLPEPAEPENPADAGDAALSTPAPLEANSPAGIYDAALLAATDAADASQSAHAHDVQAGEQGASNPVTHAKADGASDVPPSASSDVSSADAPTSEPRGDDAHASPPILEPGRDDGNPPIGPAADPVLSAGPPLAEAQGDVQENEATALAIEASVPAALPQTAAPLGDHPAPSLPPPRALPSLAPQSLALAARGVAGGTGIFPPAIRPVRSTPHSTEEGVPVSALESPLAHLTAMDSLVSTSREQLTRALDGVAQERRNVDRLDSMVVRLMLEREELRRANRLLRSRLAPSQQQGEWDELEIESYDAIDQTMVQLQEIVADGRSLSNELRATLDRGAQAGRRIASHAMRARQDLLDVRQISLQSQWERLDQVVVSTASRLGRQVRFVMDADVPLDREVAESLEVPLQHIVRNAVYHGIEDPADRRYATKNPQATVWLHATESAAGIRIEVRDDGRGIDIERVVAVAVGRGVLDEARASALTAQQKLELIFISGLSTAESATDLAGRGVGMDAVLSTMRAIRGEVEVLSEAGQGTIVVLRAPRSLSSALVVIARQNGHELALPFEQVVDSYEVGQDALIVSQAGRALPLDGRQLPVFEGGLLDSTPQHEEAHYTLLEIAAPGGNMGVLVSAVLDVETALVEPPPPLLRGVGELLGFLPVVSGRARPLIDAARVVSRPGASYPTVAAGADGGAVQRAAAKPFTVLVVDDSTSVRRHLRNLFMSAGYTVREASAGIDALQDVARRGVPNLITLDVEMPGMDGMETLGALRSSHGSEVPIFMITSRAQDRHREAARSLGATRYFNKPFNPDEVLGAASLEITKRHAPPGDPAAASVEVA